MRQVGVTPALREALAASTTVSVATVTAFCAQYGTPATSSGTPAPASPAWPEPVVNNDGGYFHGYRHLWAHGGGTWVEVDVQGWSSLSNGGVATIGPVETWNDITE